MRLIDADALLKEYEGAFAYKLLKEVVGNMPTVETTELQQATRIMYDLELSATEIEREGLIRENNDLKYELRKAIMYVKDVPEEILNRWIEKSKR